MFGKCQQELRNFFHKSIEHRTTEHSFRHIGVMVDIELLLAIRFWHCLKPIHHITLIQSSGYKMKTKTFLSCPEDTMMHTSLLPHHTNACQFNGQFPDESGLAGHPLNFLSIYILSQWIPSKQAKNLNIVFNTISSYLSRASPPSQSHFFHHSTTSDPFSIIFTNHKSQTYNSVRFSVNNQLWHYKKFSLMTATISKNEYFWRCIKTNVNVGFFSINSKDNNRLTCKRSEWDWYSDFAAELITFERAAQASKWPFIISRSKLGSCTRTTDIFGININMLLHTYSSNINNLGK